MAESILEKLLRSYKLPEGFILNSDLQEITDWDRLAVMWDKTAYRSVPRQQIEARMAEVLPLLLPSISELDTLVAMRKKTSYQSQAQELIWARAIEVITSPRDWNELAMLWNKVSRIEAAREQVEAAMAEVLPALLPDIQDWNSLAQMWDKTSYQSLANQLIEARMAEVLPTSLCEIDAWDRLAGMWDRTDYRSVSRQLIEARMAEVLPLLLPGITDWHELAGMLAKASDDTEAGSQIIARMQEILPDWLLSITNYHDLIAAWTAVIDGDNFKHQFTGRLIEFLKTINDWVELVNIWNRPSTASLQLRPCIEARTAEVVKSTSNWRQLAEMRTITCSGSALQEQVLARMAEVLPDLLPHINEWDELVAMRSDSVANSVQMHTCCSLVEERMVELISAVTASQCPEWFPTLLKHLYPPSIRPALDQKVAELKKELNITD